MWSELELTRRLRPLTRRLRSFLADQISPHHRPTIDPDDLLQEVQIAVLAKGPDCFFRDDGDFESWVFTVARRKLIDEIRAQSALKRGAGLRAHAGQFDGDAESLAAALASMSGVKTPSREAAVNEMREAMLAAIAQLPEPQKSAIRFHHFEGRSVQQVADALGLTFDQTRSSLYRGRCRLGELLGRATRYFSDALSSEDASRGKTPV